MKEKKFGFVEIFYFIVICIFAVFGLSSAIIGVDVKVSYETAATNTMTASQISIKENGDRIYDFTDCDFAEHTDCVMFYTTHQEAFVYADGKEIFSREKNDSIFGHSTGSTWNFVTVPRGTETLEVVTKPSYDSNVEITFFQGDPLQLLPQKIANSFWGTVVCLSLIIIGIFMTAFWIVGFRHNIVLQDVFYLGLMSILLGIWSLGEMDLVQIVISDRVTGSFFGYACIMLLGPTLILFVKNFLRPVDHDIYKGIIAAELCFDLLLLVLQIVDVVDFKQMGQAIQMVVPIGAIYWVYAIIDAFFHHTNTRKAVTNTIGAVILISGAALDLYNYYHNRSEANQMSKVGFLLYIILVGMETSRYAYFTIEEHHKMRLYQDMAIKDMLTGCYNRNAFDMDTKEIKKPKNICVVNFDLNNLKLCNDNLGHAAGDAYLQEAANFLQEIFGHYGKVYRIGGDEFCTLLRDKDCDLADRLCKKIDLANAYFKRNYQIDHIGIAYGYAAFSSENEESFAELQARADSNMYKNKKKSKHKL